MNQLLQFIDKFPFVVFLLSFLIGYLLMPVVIEIAKKHNFVVSPNKRTSHNGDVPNIGGINIFVSFLLTVFFFTFNFFPGIQYATMGLAIILVVGFIDDLIELNVWWKLSGQILSGFFLIVLGNMRFVNLDGFLGIGELSIIISYLLSFAIFILLVNAFNLIDGIDGLASGLGLLYSLFYGLYFYIVKSSDLSVVAFAMFGSLAVFFYYNVFSDKNKIFMGDSGSLLLGYVMFIFILKFSDINLSDEVMPKFDFHSPIAISVTVLLIPLFDAVRVAITRIKQGRSPFAADRNHIHHLLLGLGMSHKQVTFLLMFVTLLLMILALVMKNLSAVIILCIDLLIASSLTQLLWQKINRKNTGQK